MHANNQSLPFPILLWTRLCQLEKSILDEFDDIMMEHERKIDAVDHELMDAMEDAMNAMTEEEEITDDDEDSEEDKDDRSSVHHAMDLGPRKLLLEKNDDSNMDSDEDDSSLGTNCPGEEILIQQTETDLQEKSVDEHDRSSKRKREEESGEEQLQKRHKQMGKAKMERVMNLFMRRQRLLNRHRRDSMRSQRLCLEMFMQKMMILMLFVGIKNHSTNMELSTV